jgi:dihydrofolate reductase
MRKLVVLTFVTLDGVMQAPGGPEEDPSGGFTHGGWSAGYWDDFLGNVMTDQMKWPFDLLLGRKTYEIFAAYWPKAGAESPGAKELNSARKFVASTTLKKLDWANSVLLTGDVVQEIRRVKEESGPELQVHGSSNLIQTLLKNDLIDEFRLKIFPITLGAGKRLFAEGSIPAGFKLTESKASPKGVIVANYGRAGEVKSGSFAEGPPSQG